MASNLPPLEAAAGSIPTSPCPSRRAASPCGRLALLALLLGLIVLAMIPVVRAWRRRRRLRRASDEPRGLILATYDVFTERAGELGFPREPGQTVRGVPGTAYSPPNRCRAGTWTGSPG